MKISRLILAGVLSSVTSMAWAAPAVHSHTCEVIASFGPDSADARVDHGVLFPTSSALPDDLKALLEKRGYKLIDLVKTSTDVERLGALAEAEKRNTLFLDFSADVLFLTNTGEKFCNMKFQLKDPTHELAKGAESSGSHWFPPEWLCTSVEGKLFSEIPSCAD